MSSPLLALLTMLLQLLLLLVSRPARPARLLPALLLPARLLPLRFLPVMALSARVACADGCWWADPAVMAPAVDPALYLNCERLWYLRVTATC